MINGIDRSESQLQTKRSGRPSRSPKEFSSGILTFSKHGRLLFVREQSLLRQTTIIADIASRVHGRLQFFTPIIRHRDLELAICSLSQSGMETAGHMAPDVPNCLPRAVIDQSRQTGRAASAKSIGFARCFSGCGKCPISPAAQRFPRSPFPAQTEKEIRTRRVRIGAEWLNDR
jgi:hypothetical protein